MFDTETFHKYVLIIAQRSAPYASSEYYNGTLFVAGCNAREASKIQTEFECVGLGVVVTPGDEYSFDFI
jgi:hypothetical protein